MRKALSVESGDAMGRQQPGSWERPSPRNGPGKERGRFQDADRVGVYKGSSKRPPPVRERTHHSEQVQIKQAPRWRKTPPAPHPGGAVMGSIFMDQTLLLFFFSQHDFAQFVAIHLPKFGQLQCPFPDQYLQLSLLFTSSFAAQPAFSLTLFEELPSNSRCCLRAQQKQ